MQENNPNITQPRWMTKEEREQFNQAVLIQAACDLSDSQRAETLANEHVKELNRLAAIYLTEEQQSTLKDYMTDAMNETFSAYKGDE